MSLQALWKFLQFLQITLRRGDFWSKSSLSNLDLKILLRKDDRLPVKLRSSLSEARSRKLDSTFSACRVWNLITLCSLHPTRLEIAFFGFIKNHNLSQNPQIKALNLEKDQVILASTHIKNLEVKNKLPPLYIFTPPINFSFAL